MGLRSCQTPVLPLEGMGLMGQRRGTGPGRLWHEQAPCGSEGRVIAEWAQACWVTLENSELRRTRRSVRQLGLRKNFNQIGQERS